jgi:hypothetical protein
MRPNLSLTNIAGALAVLGTSAALLACGGDKANANEVKSADPAKAAESHCGADKEHKSGAAQCGAKDPGHGPATASSADPGGAVTGAAGSATAAAASAAPAATNAAATPSASAKPASSAKPAGGSGKGGTKGGQASCGAGTCSAKK